MKEINPKKPKERWFLNLKFTTTISNLITFSSTWILLQLLPSKNELTVFTILLSQGRNILPYFLLFLFLLTFIFTSSKGTTSCNGLKKVTLILFETLVIVGFIRLLKKCWSSRAAETMQVAQWILMWEYVKKNCTLKLTNMKSCFNKTEDTRTTEGGEGICLSPLCQDAVNQH